MEFAPCSKALWTEDPFPVRIKEEQISNPSSAVGCPIKLSDNIPQTLALSIRN